MRYDRGMRSAIAIAVGIVIGICVPAVGYAQPREAGPELKIVILLGSSGRGDKSFTDAALAGLDAAKKHGRLAVVERLPSRPEEYGATIDQLAADGPDLIIGVGFLYTDAFLAASVRHPQLRFLLLDAELPNRPNVKSVTFRADEGSFLAGVVAAMESKRAAVGFIGGMNMPTIQAFECGFETGVRFAAKQGDRTVKGYVIYIGTTPEAFSNPAEGAELARAMIAQQGVDVLFAAAGASGLGVIEAARQAKVKAIGVDTDQHHIAPDVVITSMRKRLDRAVETAVADVRRGSFRGGVTVMTLANGGVDLVLPGRLAPATQKLVERARAAVVDGERAACGKPHVREPAWPVQRR
jgi:basic membrane protein A